MMHETKNILEVKNLSTTFVAQGKRVKAVDQVSFTLGIGKVLGIVGESGSGKTVTALSIMRLIDPPGKIKADAIILNSMQENEITQDLLQLSEVEMQRVRGKRIAMIFQEPMTSLNPVYTIGDQIMEAILLHQDVNKIQARMLAIEMLGKVKIPDPEKRIDDYPHQLSGGMRQRVMIAMALSCEPDILIADEPTTALDVTVQAQILHLIRELVDEIGMSVILITHDLGVVAQVCDEVIVMYAGSVVEQGGIERILQQPKHPYTIGLLHSVPSLLLQEVTLTSIPGRVPSLLQLPQGCRFADRCDRKVMACEQKIPDLKYVGQGQIVRCVNY